MRAAAAVILLSLAATQARAAPQAALKAASQAAPEPAPAAPPKTVSPLTVVPGDRASVVSSYPAAGQVVAPGVLVLKITFDQKMLASAFDITAGRDGTMPQCLKTPRLLNDGKTFVLLCTTAPKTSYALAFNAEAGGGFQNEGGVRAQSSTLAFSTNDGDGPVDLADAMKAAKLGDGDMPIVDIPTDAAAGSGAH